ncbi:hypothetical protein AB1046_21580 [Promicromonospora sp. Populi]|uniref:hypothetical protein n=1 Tax=Promicromonospora sp. Populi TaxID=3239420 RepID=UPI0034E20FCD
MSPPGQENDRMQRAEDQSGRTRARALRGVLAASSATLVALLSHVAGGGEMPGALGIVVPLALSLPVCMAWSAQHLSLPRLSASVVVSQVFFHVLFVLGTPRGPATASSGLHAAHAGMTRSTTSAQLPGQQSGQMAEMVHADVTMWVWHAVAAVATVVVLYRGELMLLRLRALADRTAAWLLRGLRFADEVAAVVLPALPGVVAATFRPLHPGPQLTPLRRRGPPALHAV